MDKVEHEPPAYCGQCDKHFKSDNYWRYSCEKMKAEVFQTETYCNQRIQTLQTLLDRARKIIGSASNPYDYKGDWSEATLEWLQRYEKLKGGDDAN